MPAPENTATIAELCFALQWVLFVRRVSEMTAIALLDAGRHSCRWSSSLWALMMLILALATGLRGCRYRRHPTLTWEVWREEAPWMILYFSFGVWTSLATVRL